MVVTATTNFLPSAEIFFATRQLYLGLHKVPSTAISGGVFYREGREKGGEGKGEGREGREKELSPPLCIQGKVTLLQKTTSIIGLIIKFRTNYLLTMRCRVSLP